MTSTKRFTAVKSYRRQDGKYVKAHLRRIKPLHDLLIDHRESERREVFMSCDCCTITEYPIMDDIGETYLNVIRIWGCAHPNREDRLCAKCYRGTGECPLDEEKND
jgi:hypothetical protein